MADGKLGTLYVDIRAGLASLEKDLGKVGSTLKGWEGSLKTFLGVGGAVGVAAAAFAGFYKVINHGQDVGELSATFDLLQKRAGTTAGGLETLRVSSQGLIADLDLMKQSNQALLAGLTPEQFNDLASAADTLGDAIGSSATEELEKLTTAAIKGNDKLLQLEGIFIDNKKAEDDFAKSLGITSDKLSETGKREADRIAILEKIKQRTQELAGENKVTLADAFTKAFNAGKTLFDRMASAINENTALANAINNVATSLQDLAKEANPVVQELEKVEKRIISLKNAASQDNSAVPFQLQGKFAQGQAAAQAESASMQGYRDFLKEAISSNSFLGKFVDTFGQLGERVKYTKEQIEDFKDKGALAKDALTAAQKAAKEAANAIDALGKSLADSKASAEIDKIKQSVDNLVSGVGNIAGLGSSADLTSFYEEYRTKVLDKLYADQKDNLDKLSGVQLENAKKTINEIADYDLQVYQQQIAQKQLEIDLKNHEKSVDFFKGLLEDAITNTRFSFVDQFKKAAVEIGAEFLANLIKANILGSKSFADLFGKVTNALFDGASSWFSKSGIGQAIPGIGSLFGPSAQGGASTVMSGSSELSAGLSELTSGTAAASTGLEALAAAAIPAAAVAGGIYAAYSNVKNFGKWGSNTSNERKGFDSATALVDLFAPGIGTIINKALGSFFSAGAFTKNQQSLKNFEKFIEDTLKKSLGKSFDFVLGDIGQFDDGKWADTFWTDFGDKGAGTFNALGVAFEKILGLQKGVGGQIGALLAQNLAGSDLNQSLDNIKLLMDSIGVSTEDLMNALLETAKAGEITWQEFDIMRQKLEQVPASGLAGLGDIKGAFDQILTSGGKGIQAINGIKNIAIEAGEAGVKNFDQLRAHLTAAGYDAQTVDAFFQALSQRGITSFEQFATASEASLGGIIADMTTLGVEFDKFSPKEGLDETTQGFETLADQIKNVHHEINSLPDSVHIQTSIAGDGVTPNAKGNVIGFASGGVFDKTTLFKMPRMGGIGSLGEAGPEAIMPLKRINGRLGVLTTGSGGGPQIHLTVNAPYAQAGASQEILMAFSSVKNEIMRNVSEAINSHSRRTVY